jgi:hypothetical protein
MGYWDFVTTQAAKQKQSVDLFAAKLVGRYSATKRSATKV